MSLAGAAAYPTGSMAPYGETVMISSIGSFGVGFPDVDYWAPKPYTMRSPYLSGLRLVGIQSTSQSPTASSTQTPSTTPSTAPTPTGTQTPSTTISPTQTISSTPSAGATMSTIPSASGSPTPSSTMTESQSSSQGATVSPSCSASQMATPTMSCTPSPSQVGTLTGSDTGSATASQTTSPSPSQIPTPIMSFSGSPFVVVIGTPSPTQTLPQATVVVSVSPSSTAGQVTSSVRFVSPVGSPSVALPSESPSMSPSNIDAAVLIVGGELPSQLGLIVGASAASSLLVLVLVTAFYFRHLRRGHSAAANKCESAVVAAEATDSVASMFGQLGGALSGGSSEHQSTMLHVGVLSLPESGTEIGAVQRIPGLTRRISAVVPLDSEGSPEQFAIPLSAITSGLELIVPITPAQSFTGNPQRRSSTAPEPKPPSLPDPEPASAIRGLPLAGTPSTHLRRASLPDIDTPLGCSTISVDSGIPSSPLNSAPVPTGACRHNRVPATAGAVRHGMPIHTLRSSGGTTRPTDVLVMPAQRGAASIPPYEAWGVVDHSDPPAPSPSLGIDALDSLVRARRRLNSLPLAADISAVGGLASPHVRCTQATATVASLAVYNQRPVRSSALISAAGMSFNETPPLLSPGVVTRQRRASVA